MGKCATCTCQIDTDCSLPDKRIAFLRLDRSSIAPQRRRLFSPPIRTRRIRIIAVLEHAVRVARQQTILFQCQPHPPLDLERALAAVPAPTFGRRARRNGAGASGVATCTRFRIRFEKGSAMRFTSHLDLMRTWERTLRRSGLPLAFSQGHHPHIKMSFGPPLPLGYRSRAEVFDLEFSRPPAVDLADRLGAVLPDGLSLVSFRPILFKTPSLMSQLEGASYRVRFPRSFRMI